MTPLNSSVKMSPYEERDSFIESKGTATSDGVKPGRARGAHGPRGWDVGRTLAAAGTETSGSIPTGGGCCHSPWQSRSTAGPPYPRRHQEAGSGPGPRSLSGVEPLPPAGAIGGAGGADAKPFFPVAHLHLSLVICALSAELKLDSVSTGTSALAGGLLPRFLFRHCL